LEKKSTEEEGAALTEDDERSEIMEGSGEY
jgi:hypothetical protein